MLGKVTTIDPCEPGQQTNSSYDLLQVVDHYEKPRNVGSFDKKDIDVGTGLVGAPACGDVMKLQIRVRPLCCFEVYLLKSLWFRACCFLTAVCSHPLLAIIPGVCCRSMRLETLWTHASRHLAAALQLHPAAWPQSGKSFTPLQSLWRACTAIASCIKAQHYAVESVTAVRIFSATGFCCWVAYFACAWVQGEGQIHQ